MTAPAPTFSADLIARDQVICSLVPFFLAAALGNPSAARAAAEAMLAGYNTGTTEQLQLAAQIVAFSFAALDSLRRSAAEPDLPVNIQLRLRGNANAMNRAAQQCRRALELRRKAAASPQAAGALEPHVYTEAEISTAMAKASQAIAYARSDLEPGKPMSYTKRMQESERLKRLSKRQTQALSTAASNANADARTETVTA
jgi:hypothetical protein